MRSGQGGGPRRTQKRDVVSWTGAYTRAPVHSITIRRNVRLSRRAIDGRSNKFAPVSRSSPAIGEDQYQGDDEKASSRSEVELEPQLDHTRRADGACNRPECVRHRDVTGRRTE